MKKPVLTKAGKLPQLHDVRARLYADDIMQLFLERLNNHTLSEVCKYIAGYFYRQQIANFNKIKEQANRIATLECEITSNAIHLDATMVSIEKLEAALRVIVQVWDTDQPISIARAALARDAARKALEGKDD